VLVTGYNSQGKQLTGTDESTVLSDLGLFSVPNSVTNELEIIHSRTLIEQTVHDLQLNVSYWGQGSIRYEEIYKNSPYFIKLLSLKNISEPIEYDVRSYKIRSGLKMRIPTAPLQHLWRHIEFQIWQLGFGKQPCCNRNKPQAPAWN